MTSKENKWFWMMDYCKIHRLPPAQSWAWNKAKEEWVKWKKSNM